MRTDHPFISPDEQRKNNFRRQIIKLMEETALPLKRPLEIECEDEEADRTLLEGQARRRRVFGASSWKVRDALGVLIEFIELDRLDRSDIRRKAIEALCTEPLDSMGFMAGYEGYEHAAAWIAAIARDRAVFRWVEDRMHPLLWMRWALTRLPQAIHWALWTEFGLWRCEAYPASQPALLANYSDDSPVLAISSDDFGIPLIPMESFLNQPMEDRDFEVRILVVDIRNANAATDVVAEQILARMRANETKGGKSPIERWNKAAERVGRANMTKIERVFDRVKKAESKRRSWQYGEGPHGFALCVPEKLDEVTDLVLAEADRLGEPLKRSIVRGALGAWINFRIGRR